MIGSKRMVLAARGGGGVDKVMSLDPTYMWPLQKDLLDVAGLDKHLTIDGDAVIFTDPGPGYGVEDTCVATTGFLGLKNTTIDMAENSAGYSYGGWFWFASPSNPQGIISNYGNSMLYLPGSTGYVYHAVQSTSFSNTTIPVSTWTHLLVTYNFTDKKIRYYINGALYHTSVDLTQVPNSATSFRIGGYGSGTGKPLNAKAAYCAWWVNRTLNDSEATFLATLA